MRYVLLHFWHELSFYLTFDLSFNLQIFEKECLVCPSEELSINFEDIFWEYTLSFWINVPSTKKNTKNVYFGLTWQSQLRDTQN